MIQRRGLHVRQPGQDQHEPLLGAESEAPDHVRVGRAAGRQRWRCERRQRLARLFPGVAAHAPLHDVAKPRDLARDARAVHGRVVRPPHQLMYRGCAIHRWQITEWFHGIVPGDNTPHTIILNAPGIARLDFIGGGNEGNIISISEKFEV